MNERSDERPSAAVLLAGGFGVLVVLAFVASMAAADLSTPSLGPRVRLVQGPVLLVARCQDERVTSLQVGDLHEAFPGGTLDRRFPLSLRRSATAAGSFLRIEVRLGATVLTATADLGHLPADPGGPEGTPPPCTHRRISAATVLFGAAALVVVGGYGVMVMRTLRR